MNSVGIVLILSLEGLSPKGLSVEGNHENAELDSGFNFYIVSMTKYSHS